MFDATFTFVTNWILYTGVHVLYLLLLILIVIELYWIGRKV